MSEELKTIGESVAKLNAQLDDVAAQMKADAGNYSELEQKFDKINEEITKQSEKYAKLESAVNAKNYNPEEAKAENAKVSKAIVAEFMKSGDKGSLDKFAMKYMADNGIEAKDLQIRIPEDGGYITMPEFGGIIDGRVFETSPMRQEATVVSGGSPSYKVVVDDDEAGAEWSDETTAHNTTDTPQLREIEIVAHDLKAKPSITQNMIDDAIVDVESWLANKVADKFRRTENTAFVLGNNAKRPKGFTTYTQNTSDPDGYVYDQLGTITLASNTEIRGDEVLDVIGNLKAEHRPNAKWFFNRTVETVIRKSVKLNASDKADNFLWQPGLQAGTPNTLAGYPVVNFEDMAGFGADNIVAAFGDMRQSYLIYDRIGLRVLRDPYTNDPYVVFKTTKRVGGGLVSFDSLKLVKAAS